MYVYESNDDKVRKYEVFYDREKLEDLKDKVIENCSYIKHIKTSTTNPYSIKGSLDCDVRNLTYKQNPSIDRFDHFEDDYDVEYDKVIYPNLVGIIYSFLRNEVSAIKDLENYEVENLTDSIAIKIELLNDAINTISNTEFDLKKKKLDELEELVNEAKLNENKESTEIYFEELKSLITAQFIDEIDKDILYHATNFLGASKVNIHDKLNITKINKVAQRNLK